MNITAIETRTGPTEYPPQTYQESIQCLLNNELIVGKKAFIKAVKSWLADLESNPETHDLTRHTKPRTFPVKWMETDPGIATMRERTRFDDVMNYLVRITRDRETCLRHHLEAVSIDQTASLPAINRGTATIQPHHVMIRSHGPDFSLVDDMAHELKMSKASAKKYLHTLSGAGALRQFGTRNKVYYSFGYWNETPHGWNRVYWVSVKADREGMLKRLSGISVFEQK